MFKTNHFKERKDKLKDTCKVQENIFQKSKQILQ